MVISCIDASCRLFYAYLRSDSKIHLKPFHNINCVPLVEWAQRLVVPVSMPVAGVDEIYISTRPEMQRK